MNTELTQEVMDLVKKHKLLGSGSSKHYTVDHLPTNTCVDLDGLVLSVTSIYGKKYPSLLTKGIALQLAITLLNNVIYSK